MALLSNLDKLLPPPLSSKASSAAPWWRQRVCAQVALLRRQPKVLGSSMGLWTMWVQISNRLLSEFVIWGKSMNLSVSQFLHL